MSIGTRSGMVADHRLGRVKPQELIMVLFVSLPRSTSSIRSKEDMGEKLSYPKSNNCQAQDTEDTDNTGVVVPHSCDPQYEQNTKSND
jgi:hypothetical protein